MALTEKLSILIDAKTGGAVKEFDKVAKSTKDVEVGTGKASKALQGMGLSGKVSGQALAAGVGAGALAAGAAIAQFAAASIAHFADTAQSVRAFQRVTGQSAEDASHFVSAFDDMGISAETASSAMFKLSKNISSGGKSLTDLGIGIAHTSDGATDLQGTFLNIADAVSKTSDPAERASIAFAAFGKQGAALLPILEKGRKGIQEMFKDADLNFSQAQLDSAEDYRLALDHLSDSVGKVQNRLGGALLPTVTQAADGFAHLIDKTSEAVESNNLLGDAATGLGHAFLSSVGGPLDAVVSGLGFLSKNSDDSKVSMDEAAQASGYLGTSLEDLAGKTKDQVAAMVEEKKALDDVYSATLAQFDANFGYQDALNGTEDAALKVTEAQNNLTEARKAGDPAGITAATEELSRALLSQQEQALQAANAAGRLAEEQAKAAQATDTTTPKINAQIAELERQKATIAGKGGNVEVIQAMIDKLNSIKSQYTTNITATDNATPTINAVQARVDRLVQSGNITIGGIGSGGGGIHFGKTQTRAAGGSVMAGVPYTINERGSETVTFPAAGTVHPANLTPAGGGANYTINVYAGMGTDGAEVGRQVAEALKQHQRRGGQVPWAN